MYLVGTFTRYILKPGERAELEEFLRSNDFRVPALGETPTENPNIFDERAGDHHIRECGRLFESSGRIFDYPAGRVDTLDVLFGTRLHEAVIGYRDKVSRKTSPQHVGAEQVPA